MKKKLKNVAAAGAAISYAFLLIGIYYTGLVYRRHFIEKRK